MCRRGCSAAGCLRLWHRWRMAQLGGTVMTAAGVFAGTNVDGFLLLVVLFLGSRDGGLRTWQIVLGQYLAFTALVAVSAAAAAGLATVPLAWVGLLGIVPLALGVRGLVAAGRDAGSVHQPIVPGRLPTATVAALTVAVGGDNLSAYIVLFRTQTAAASVVTVLAFLLLLVVWCAVARLVATRTRAVPALIRVNRWLVPTVFMAIGVAIPIRTGALVRLARLLI
jgi:cadmium resistance protein CadD (predicted permease)